MNLSRSWVRPSAGISRWFPKNLGRRSVLYLWYSLTFIFYAPGHDICLAIVQSLSPFKRWVINKTNGLWACSSTPIRLFLMKVFNFFILPKGAVSRDSKSQMLSNLKIRPPSLPHHSCCLKSITCSNVHIGFLIFLDVGFDIIQMINPPLKVVSHICFGFAKVVQK